MQMTTLGELWQRGWTISARCCSPGKRGMKTGHACTWRYELDPQTLLVTRGAPFPLERLSEMMICPRCRQRQVMLTFQSPAQGASAFRMMG
jgi:hypothetical protein